MINNARYTLTGTRLAKLCGVSQGTVDRALHGRSDINEQTRQKILRIAEQYGFLTSEGPFATGIKGVIGVIVLDVSNEYFSNLIMYIEKHCRALGYAISVMFSMKDPQREIENIESLYRMGVDGIILCPVAGGKNEEDHEIYRRYLLSLKIPVVTVGNEIEGVNYVGIDDYEAMCRVTEAVIARGYKRLIFPNPLNKDDEYKAVYAEAQRKRRKAFIETAERNGFSKEDIVLCTLGEAETLVPKSNTRTAFICPCDIYALRLINNAKKKDAGIIGFDDISIIDAVGIELDSVSYDVSLTAGEAVNIILKGKSDIPQKIIIDYKIISRGSL